MELIGGQAIVEGVMMISPQKVAIAVRKPNGRITTTTEQRTPFFQNIRKIYFIRGIFALLEMLHLGVKGLIWSSKQTLPEEEHISSTGFAVTMMVAFLLAMGLFVALPLWLAQLVSEQHLLFTLLDGVFRVVLFLGYLLFIAQMRDVKRLFEYHGAEHMVVHCYEAKKKLEINTVRTFPTAHPRCGTAFIFLVLLLSIFIFSLIWSDQWLIRFGLRLLFVPVIAGLAYEILRFGAKHQDALFFRWLIMPGLWFQKITTKEPDKRQIEVAITALQKVIT
ncbi:MAG: DUF1385 domain-containing protein [Nanoarchaeota archaeon]